MMKKFALVLLVSVGSVSCKNTWSQEDKDAFYQACTEEAKTWAGSDSVAKSYCDCVLGKMVQKYPNEQDALEHLDVLAKDTGLIGCKLQIQGK